MYIIHIIIGENYENEIFNTGSFCHDDVLHNGGKRRRKQHDRSCT